MKLRCERGMKRVGSEHSSSEGEGHHFCYSRLRPGGYIKGAQGSRAGNGPQGKRAPADGPPIFNEHCPYPSGRRISGGARRTRLASGLGTLRRRSPGRWPLRYLLHLLDRKSTRLNSSHANISYAVFCLKKKIIHLSTDFCCTIK